MAKASGRTHREDKMHSYHFLSENEYRNLSSSQNGLYIIRLIVV